MVFPDKMILKNPEGLPAAGRDEIILIFR